MQNQVRARNREVSTMVWSLGGALFLVAITILAWAYHSRDAAFPSESSADDAQAQTGVENTRTRLKGEKAVSSRKEALDFPRLSSSDRRTIRDIETVFHTGDEDQAEAVFRQCLADLLPSGGGRLADHLLAESPPGPLREKWLRACEIVWPKVDPAGAFAWASHLPDAAERNEASERMLASFAGIDPAEAVRLAEARDNSGEGNGALTRRLVGQWTTSDFGAARQWALRLPAGEKRDHCIAQIATVQAQSFPADAARMAVKRLPPGSVLDETVMTILHHWTVVDPEAALRWVESFPVGELRNRASRELDGLAVDRDEIKP